MEFLKKELTVVVMFVDNANAEESKYAGTRNLMKANYQHK